jgi:hypothetical protein
VIDLFTKAYESLNKGLFDSKLPTTIEFSPTLNRKDIFHFGPPDVFEIGTGFITARPVEIIDDLLHNMVHVYNHVQDTPDVTQNQYHNLAFCEKALDVGLIVVCHKTRGWGVTHTDPDALTDKIRHPKETATTKRSEVYDQIKLPDESLAEFQRELQEKLGDKPAKQFQFKYVCKCDPPFIVRVGKRPDGDRPFDARCGYCDTIFVLDESRPSL